MLYQRPNAISRHWVDVAMAVLLNCPAGKYSNPPIAFVAASKVETWSEELAFDATTCAPATAARLPPAAPATAPRAMALLAVPEGLLAGIDAPSTGMLSFFKSFGCLGGICVDAPQP